VMVATAWRAGLPASPDPGSIAVTLVTAGSKTFLVAKAFAGYNT